MKNFLIFSLIIISVSCCKPVDPPPPTPSTTGNLRVSFIANFNGQPFVLDDLYNATFNYRIKSETLKFLVHHIYAKKSSGDSTEINQHMYVNFSNTSNAFTVAMAPGTYSGIKFGLGVDGSLNHSDPSLLPPSHSFSINQANDMFWTWATGYIFTKYEGRADTTGTLSGPTEQLFFFHTGADTLFREIDLAQNFSINLDQTTTVYIDLDVNKLLNGTNDTINLKIDNGTHTMGNLPLASRFVALLSKAFSIHL